MHLVKLVYNYLCVETEDSDEMYTERVGQTKVYLKCNVCICRF